MGFRRKAEYESVEFFAQPGEVFPQVGSKQEACSEVEGVAICAACIGGREYPFEVEPCPEATAVAAVPGVVIVSGIPHAAVINEEVHAAEQTHKVVFCHE